MSFTNPGGGGLCSRPGKRLDVAKLENLPASSCMHVHYTAPLENESRFYLACDSGVDNYA